jgi:DNA sulfur modification protein DndB
MEVIEKEAPVKEAVLGPLAIERNDRVTEYKRRRPQLLQKRLPVAEAAKYLENGWSQRRLLPKDRVIIEKRKSHDEILENRLWCVLYQFGFAELSRTRQFQIQVTGSGDPVYKQIDVYAKIGDIAVVAECKSNATKQGRHLQKDIGELSSLQRPISNALRHHYGADGKLKIIWLLVTSNIVWSSPDRARAKEGNIQIIQEHELRYFEEISKKIGHATRYQFIGEFLRTEKVPGLANYSVPAIRAKMGGVWTFYFLAPPDRLLPIAFVNHRGLRDLDGAPAYQRLLVRSRLKEIGEYLDSGGFFPNSILLNFKDTVRFEKHTSFDDRHISFGTLYLPDRFKSAWVIDGQHRLFGFTETTDEKIKHTIPVLAFEKLDKLSEAELFATINSKQQKVQKGLLDELAGELKLDSDDFDERCSGIASRALDLMASETGSPFEDRIKTADLADSDTICLTISEIKRAIISTRLLGSLNRKTGLEIPGPFTRGTVKETVEALAEGLTIYFKLIANSNQERWERGRPGYLCSNIGVQGFIRLLAALVEFMKGDTHQEPSSLEADALISQIECYLKPVLEFVETAEDVEFGKRFKQPFGSGGPPRYFAQLCKLVIGQYPAFKPAGLEEVLAEQESETVDQADALVKSIVDRVHGYVVNSLKQSYGPGYFDKGIPQKEIKLKAHNSMYDERGDPMPIETYLDFIDLKKIVEHTQNWSSFSTTFNIRLPGEKGGQAKYLRWMDSINEIRRVPAHPYGRKYKDDQIELLGLVDDKLRNAGI